MTNRKSLGFSRREEVNATIKTQPLQLLISLAVAPRHDGELIDIGEFAADIEHSLTSEHSPLHVDFGTSAEALAKARATENFNEITWGGYVGPYLISENTHVEYLPAGSVSPADEGSDAQAQPTITTTVLARDLIELVKSSDSELIRIVSDTGSAVTITGNVFASTTFPDMIGIKTELGVLYIEQMRSINIARTAACATKQHTM